jgi:hypothetical protein
MDELAQIAAHIRRAAQIYVLFYTPSAATRDWENSDLRDAAARIPGVTVLSDIDGVEAERFGAETSGHTFLFATDGRLLFSGGITASRGHVGDNAGESAIVSLINNQTPTRPNTFVFGCAFHDRTQQTKRPPCLR